MLKTIIIRSEVEKNAKVVDSLKLFLDHMPPITKEEEKTGITRIYYKTKKFPKLEEIRPAQ